MSYATLQAQNYPIAKYRALALLKRPHRRTLTIKPDVIWRIPRKSGCKEMQAGNKIWRLAPGIVVSATISFISLAFAAAVIAAFLFYWRPQGYDQETIFQLTENNLPILKPSLDIQRGENKSLRLRTNALGARSDVDAYQGHETILVFGDSNVAAIFLNEEQTLTAQLEVALKKKGRVVTAVNFGVPGYGPDQSLLRFGEVVDRPLGNIKAAVLHVFADNDFGDLYRNNIVRKARSGWELTRPSKDPTLSPFQQFMERRKLYGILDVWDKYNLYRLLPRYSRYYQPPSDWIPEGTAPTQLTDDQKTRVIEAGLAKVEKEKQGYRSGGYTSWRADSYDFDLALGADPALRDQTVEMLSYVISQFSQTARSRDMCPIVLIEPSKIDIQGWAVSAEDLQRFSKQHNFHYSRRNLVEIAKEAASRAETKFVDLFDLYSATDGNYFTYDEAHYDDHWSPVGIRRAAEALASELDTSGCLQ